MLSQDPKEERCLDYLLQLDVSCDLEDAIKRLPAINLLGKQEWQQLNELVSHIVAPAIVKDFQGQNEREYDSSDFVDILESTPLVFSCLEIILSRIKLSQASLSYLDGFFTSIFVLCGTHNNCSFPWCSEEAESSAHGIELAVLDVTQQQSLESLICSNIKGYPYTLFKSTLLSIRPSLMTDTWTRNPSTCHIFRWLLSHVKHPHLVDYLPDVLPPPLMFIGHHSTSHKILGIQCLDHIIDNIPPTELKLYSRADVVYDALFRLLYEKEVEIINILYPCLLKLLHGQNRNVHSCQKPRRWNNYDEVYHQLLWNMAIENQIKLRRAYSAQMSDMINRMGITVLKHMKRTKQVLLDYLSVYDGPEELSRINALRSLIALIKVSWPRMEHHYHDFMQKVLVLAYDIIEDESQTNVDAKNTALGLCKECLILMKAACPEKYEECSVSEIMKSMPELKIILEFI